MAGKPSASKGKKRVTFQIQAEPGSRVSVAGSFNNWDATANPMKEKDGLFTTGVMLAKGTYEYKFVVNDIWCIDPECPNWVPNQFGSLNSVLTVE